MEAGDWLWPPLKGGNILIKRVVVPSLFSENIYWYVFFFLLRYQMQQTNITIAQVFMSYQAKKNRRKQDFPIGKITVFSAFTNFE